MAVSNTFRSVSDALFDLALTASRSVVVVGTAKNVGKTTAFNALRAVAERRRIAVAVTSLGRDGEPSDALDGEAKPRVRLIAGTIVALPAGLIPSTPALAILGSGAPTALGPMVFARVVFDLVCEIGGPPTTRAMRATIRRLLELCGGPVLIDGAIDRIAPLAGGDDAIVLATGAASGATTAAVAAVAADAVARLSLPGRDAARERRRIVAIDGALDARDAADLIANASGCTVVVSDPTRVTVRGALFAALRAAVDLRCERPLRVVACTTSPYAHDGALSTRALVAAVAEATALPAFDVVGGVAAGGDARAPSRTA